MKQKALDIVLALARDAREELKMEGYEEVITNEGKVYKMTDINEAIEKLTKELDNEKS